MSDTTTATQNTPPDWETQTKELLCPLCGYNLRGLTEGRCPECGFAFTWQELFEAEKNKHLYLFEHGKGRNFKSFWKTYGRTCKPRRFWTDLNPAQPVRFLRLMIYWGIACGLMSVAFSETKISDVVKLAFDNYEARSQANAVNSVTRNWYGRALTQAEVDSIWPLPWQAPFWRKVGSGQGTSYISYYFGPNVPSVAGWAMIFLVWPWLTLISLMVFRFSMRKAKIRSVHLVRTAIYSCDFGLLLALAFVGFYAAKFSVSDGVLLVAAAVVCSIITSYRLTIAFNQYLRVHRPLETVLASQLISFLIVFVVLVPIADFSRRV